MPMATFQRCSEPSMFLSSKQPISRESCIPPAVMKLSEHSVMSARGTLRDTMWDVRLCGQGNWASEMPGVWEQQDQPKTKTSNRLACPLPFLAVLAW